MFGFESARTRKSRLEVGAIIRRLVDRTTSRMPPAVDEARGTRRCKRVFPVFVLPWADGSPDFGDALFATTTELSDYGIGLVLSLPLREPDLVIGMLFDQKPYLLRGTLKHCRPMGGGFWHVGVHAIELIEPAIASPKDLQKLAAALSPRTWKT